MTTVTEAGSNAFSWTTHPAAAAWVRDELERFRAALPGLVDFERKLAEDTGTRLPDWLDHFALPRGRVSTDELARLGFVDEGPIPTLHGEASLWAHSAGMFPRVLLHDSTKAELATKAEFVADFLFANGLDDRTRILGGPGAPLRSAIVSESVAAAWRVVERHGDVGLVPHEPTSRQIKSAFWHREAFRRRRRNFDHDLAGFDHALELFREAEQDLTRDWACDLFFAAEREYWEGRNKAARLQKARQDRLGLGWANHDHHTYRSSRAMFHILIRNLEAMGFVVRERFYAGKDAGWGAQVIEQPRAGVVIFADVDLSPEEVTGDFSHNALAPRSELGTVGLWCALHGEAYLQAGMHHLECQFDFTAAREQLTAAGAPSMKPFTDFEFLRQSFTQGEVWPVAPARIDRLLAEGRITSEQAARFREKGAIGSHLEILQRADGYKGFNQTGINEIILGTDPRRQAAAAH